MPSRLFHSAHHRCQLQPVVGSSACRVRNAVGRLRSNMDLRLRRPVVHAFSLPQQYHALGIADFDGVFSLESAFGIS